MEGVRGRIGRVQVDLADDAVVSAAQRFAEQIFIESAGMAAPACARRDDDAVDIDEAAIAYAEPQEVRTVVVGVLVESEQKGIDAADAPRKESLADQPRQPVRIEP